MPDFGTPTSVNATDTCKVQHKSRAQADAHAHSRGVHRTRLVESFQMICACRAEVNRSRNAKVQSILCSDTTIPSVSFPPPPADLSPRRLRRARMRAASRAREGAVRNRWGAGSRRKWCMSENTYSYRFFSDMRRCVIADVTVRPCRENAS